MNCSLCGEVCKCLPETLPASLPRWVHDDATGAVSAGTVVDSGSEPAVACDAAGLRREMAAENGALPQSAMENSGSAASALGRDAGEGDVPAEEKTAWRDEVATRLSLYRARRKPRPPRYPSLRLVFDPPTLHAADADRARSDAFGLVTHDALALDPFRTSDLELVERGTAAAEITPPIADEPASVTPNVPQHGAQRIAKIIEFPRSSSAAPPIPLHELAGPVSQRPRILDVPNVIPAPPALGGITIESAQPPAAEKLPGIDIPLQSAPLARRLMASAIDAVIIAAACAISGFIFWKVTGVKAPRFQLLTLAALTPGLWWAVYQHLLIVYAGGTPGLRLAKLELTCFSGKAVSRSLRRWRVLASYLSALSLGMGYAWIFLDEDSLCWHDRITHTHLAPKRGQGLSSGK